MIDSGIDTSVSDLGDYVTYSTGFEVNNEGYIVENRKKEIQNRHGTVISLIIRHLCRDVEFIGVNILNERLATDGRILAYALEETLSYKPDIINLSMGTTRGRHKWVLKKIIKKATDNNIIIVAAAHNEGIVSYPAYIKGVIGVKADLSGSFFKYYFKDDFFYAPCTAEGIPGVDADKDKHLAGTSYSAAYITGHIANLKINNKIEDVSAIRKLVIACAHSK